MLDQKMYYYYFINFYTDYPLQAVGKLEAIPADLGADSLQGQNGDKLFTLLFTPGDNLG